MATSNVRSTATKLNGRGQPQRKRTLSDKRYRKRKNQAISARSRLMWMDPAYREKMKRFREYAKQHPELYTRKGVPDGMTRAEADVLWGEAKLKAKAFMAECEKQGVVPAVVVPDSDEDKAKAALNEACVMALGPTDNRTKLAAVRTVLEYTKQKPVTKIDQALSGPEAFLRAALAAHKDTLPTDGTDV